MSTKRMKPRPHGKEKEHVSPNEMRGTLPSWKPKYCDAPKEDVSCPLFPPASDLTLSLSLSHSILAGFAECTASASLEKATGPAGGVADGEKADVSLSYSSECDF